MAALRSTLPILFAAMVALPATAAVGEIITPVAATYEGSFFNPPVRLIDGSGLSGEGPLLSQLRKPACIGYV